MERTPEKFEGYLPSVGEDDLLRIEQALGVKFPESYRQFLMYSDGGEFVDNRLSLYNLYEFESVNPDPDWSPGLPGMIFFGNDCGDNIFYFDPEN
nr:SMI1/KNR4 family protein [Phormidium sp. FACHB-592]